MKRCGSCYWFDKETSQCWVNPPVGLAVPTAVPGMAIMRAGAQNQTAIAVMGITPPTHENRRCAQWLSPAGADKFFIDRKQALSQ